MTKTEINKIRELERKGFTTPFKVKDGKLVNLNSGLTYSPEQVEIVEHYRYEGFSNPSDLSILYAFITSNDDRGYVLIPFRPKGDHESIWFFSKVEKSLN